MRALSRVVAAAALAACAGCKPGVEGQATGLVERYNAALIEAYRSGDPRLVEGLVSDAEAKKVTGLIGVKYDSGITLDAQLQQFEVTAVEKRSGGVEVRTREHWHYVDRRIGTGVQVGPASDDRYEVAYHLWLANERWVVGELEFTAEPQVGRRQAFVGGFKAQHGLVKTIPGASAEGRKQ